LGLNEKDETYSSNHDILDQAHFHSGRKQLNYNKSKDFLSRLQVYTVVGSGLYECFGVSLVN
jgi:hypothetical protein